MIERPNEQYQEAVNGFLLEQSTRSVADFVKQRRRWFSGMVRVVLYSDVQARIRVPLAVFTMLWSLSWLSMAYTVVNLGFGFHSRTTLTFLGDFSLVTYTTTYMVGLFVNLRSRRLSLARRAILYAAIVMFLPAFAVMEATGVLLGLVRSERGFHVVDK